MRTHPALPITAALCCIFGVAEGQSVFPREASKGKLTPENIVIPYELAERATFCLDAMEKAKVDDATATKNWRAAYDDQDRPDPQADAQRLVQRRAR